MARKSGGVPLSKLAAGEPGDCFALLASKVRGLTRDGKPYFACQFQDTKRVVQCRVWADSPMFAACEADWHPGTLYKLRAVFEEHEKYGPQIEIIQLREVRDSDRNEGLVDADYYDCSRFRPADMLAELRTLIEAEMTDAPLKQLTLGLLADHADVLLQLPATERRFYPFPGGWLEHVLSVSRTALTLADHYRKQYPELTPPLNRDLILAGAALHDIGRAAELVPGPMGTPPEPTTAGRLFGHVSLGRDLVRTAAAKVPGLNPELVMLLEHVIQSHLALPEWGSPRLPAIPEVLVLHHADDLDAKFEMYARCLMRDAGTGAFTERDPVLGKPLFKGRQI